MRVNRARRRLIKWERYAIRCNKISPYRYPLSGTMPFEGHANAYADVMYAHRWAPRGVRIPFIIKWD